MNGNQNPAESSTRRKWLLPVIGGAVALAVIGGALAFAVAPRSDGAAPSSTPSSPAGQEKKEPSTDPLDLPTTAPSDLSEDETVEADNAADAAKAVVESMNQIAQRADGSSVGVDAIATGFVLGELQSFAREQFDLGYRQVGDAVVTSVTPSGVSLGTDPATMTLTVCVDVSAVDVLDAAGTSLKASLYNPGRPVKHVYGAEFVDGAWKLSTHDIPDQQDCAAA